MDWWTVVLLALLVFFVLSRLDTWVSWTGLLLGGLHSFRVNTARLEKVIQQYNEKYGIGGALKGNARKRNNNRSAPIDFPENFPAEDAVLRWENASLLEYSLEFRTVQYVVVFVAIMLLCFSMGGSNRVTGVFVLWFGFAVIMLLVNPLMQVYTRSGLNSYPAYLAYAGMLVCFPLSFFLLHFLFPVMTRLEAKPEVIAQLINAWYGNVMRQINQETTEEAAAAAAQILLTPASARTYFQIGIHVCAGIFGALLTFHLVSEERRLRQSMEISSKLSEWRYLVRRVFHTVQRAAPFLLLALFASPLIADHIVDDPEATAAWEAYQNNDEQGDTTEALKAEEQKQALDSKDVDDDEEEEDEEDANARAAKQEANGQDAEDDLELDQDEFGGDEDSMEQFQEAQRASSSQATKGARGMVLDENGQLVNLDADDALATNSKLAAEAAAHARGNTPLVVPKVPRKPAANPIMSKATFERLRWLLFVLLCVLHIVAGRWITETYMLRTCLMFNEVWTSRKDKLDDTEKKKLLLNINRGYESAMVSLLDAFLRAVAPWGTMLTLLLLLKGTATGSMNFELWDTVGWSLPSGGPMHPLMPLCHYVLTYFAVFFLVVRVAAMLVARINDNEAGLI